MAFTDEIGRKKRKKLNEEALLNSEVGVIVDHLDDSKKARLDLPNLDFYNGLDIPDLDDLPDITHNRVFQLAYIGMKAKWIAEMYGMSPDGFSKSEYNTSYKKGFAYRREALTLTQTHLALSGNVALLIWLGKQDLEQREPDKDSVSSDNDTASEGIVYEVIEKEPNVGSTDT